MQCNTVVDQIFCVHLDVLSAFSATKYDNVAETKIFPTARHLYCIQVSGVRSH
jgi:hypothetical protein